MKKILSVILIDVMVCMALAGCTSEKDKTAKKTEQSLKATKAEKETESKTETESVEDSKVLVVYYSASGNTERVAKEIAQETGGDLFELVPKEVYTDDDLDWTDDNSRVVKEHENPDLRDVELEYNTVDNWDSYETVLIGYPIWWGIAAWPVNSFVQLNDFTGKTVIPFCTSSSSGLGDSGDLLEKQAGTGNWQSGERFSSGVSDSDIKSWVEELGLTK